MPKQESINEKWDVQLRKGTLELVILAALKTRTLYGLELLKLLHSFETMKITEGTLYPLLDRLKRDGMVKAFWRQEGDARPRKYYQLTEQGKAKLVALTNRWRQSVADIENLIQTPNQHTINPEGASDV
ncbi:MAG: PadR family transcriptional regulator [Paraglaciecola sp.]|uniref:PadR family transcriptional regulator n=1 Tax=Paraglaciecola sp. TaxID=1920173 RepID=UPI0032992FB5